jgi:uncharacterized membrane protein (DUF106 family)
MSLTHKILISFFSLLGLAICFVGPLQEKMHQWSKFEALDCMTQKYLTDTLKKTSLSFAAARGVNALVSVAQSIETGGSIKLFGSGGSVNVSFGQILDPLNDMVERFSWLMLLSSISLGTQIFFQKALPWICSQCLFPLFFLLVLLTIWLPLKNKSPFLKISLKIMLASLIIRLILPTIALTNQAMYSLFLEKEYQTSARFIEEQDVQLTEKSDTTLFDQVKDLKEQIKRIMERSMEYFDNLIKLMIVFIIQTILLPLLTLWLIMTLLKFLVNRTGGFEIERLFKRKLIDKQT